MAKKITLKARRNIGPGPTLTAPLSQDGLVYTNAASGTTCPGAQAKDYTGQYLKIHCSRSNSSTGRCRRTYLEWNISGIPTPCVISDIILTCQVSSNPVNPRNCHIVRMDIRPSTNTAANVWNHISTNITNNNFLVANIDTFNTSGVKTINLGSTAESDLQNKRNAGNTWWALAIVYTSETRDNNLDHFTDIAAYEHASMTRPKLDVTY